ncbi:HNH endonuclease [Methylobacterium fujisawaense]|uniref:HNH endonuclease n=1 Tax=Methylobacterium fujisawaense TaxID=107400 RepID=UPI0031F52043
MSKCLLCPAEITTENDSNEHLILNAIGGRRIVRGLVCKSCNNATGHQWDTVLSTQLLPLILMFHVFRQRRSAPPTLPVTTTAGEQVTINLDGRLTLTKPKFETALTEDGKTSYQLAARTMAEARQMVMGLKRKHPEIDVDAILAQATLGESYLEGAVHHDLGVGGELAGRSMIKSCVAMAFESGVPLAFCGLAIGYLTRPDGEPCFGYYHERDLISDRPTGTPLHCLAVRADPESGLVLAYAEYFGLHRIVACIGERYSGPVIEQAYSIDPRDGRTLSLGVNLAFDRTDIRDIYDYKRTSSAGLIEAGDAILGPAFEQARRAEQERVAERAVRRAFDTCGAEPGEVLTEEHAKRIARTMAEGIAPYVLHRLRPIRR